VVVVLLRALLARDAVRIRTGADEHLQELEARERVRHVVDEAVDDRRALHIVVELLALVIGDRMGARQAVLDFLGLGVGAGREERLHHLPIGRAKHRGEFLGHGVASQCVGGARG
jgi:hypothetical protein